MPVYSRKQWELLELWRNGQLRRINLLDGSVRSGKTWIALVLWAFWVASMPENGVYLMAAKTLMSLKRNCLELLQSLVGEKNFTYSLQKKDGKLFGRKVYLEGGCDTRAESKIRGMTLQGALCDELTLFPEDFFTMLLSRLSLPGARLFATTNPDNPRHWLMRNYLNRQEKLDMLVCSFHMEDNPMLDQSYVEALKKEYTGVYYERFILGRWVAAEGAIYQSFARNPEPFLMDRPEGNDYRTWAGDVDFISIGVDFGGNRSLTTFVATAVHRNFTKLTVLSDYHIEGTKGDIDGERVNQEFLGFVHRLSSAWPGLNIRYCFADSEAQYLINGLRKACGRAGLPLKVCDCAKNPIKERIRCTETLLNTGRMKIMRPCGLVVDGLRNAMWDKTAAEQGKDVRLDDFTSDIDIVDAFEYSWERFLKKLLPIARPNEKEEKGRKLAVPEQKR
ncbi:MAG: PBSX family phage terminase large subunit [Oscillospiraceae bacterium]|nr:PBSX family phage terminase large subunit [Oscillospiraceae bacterium]